ncbi:conserved hypothetical protein [Mycobacterium tuberculosis T92]|nr:conserved hypothetical protein [Mycobacterium tuberculosis T92]
MAIWAAGDTAGVATVVRTLRSAPRPPGAAMVVAPDGSVSGSVSGGCVEGAVYELAAEVAQTGIPRLEHYGVSDDTAFAVGLTCGGIIDVFVEPVSRATFPELGELADDIGAQRPVAIATVIAHPDERRVGRRLVIRPDTKSPVTGFAGFGACRCGGYRRCAGSARGGPQRDPRIWARWAAAWRGHGGLRVQPRAAPADAGVRVPSTSPPRWGGKGFVSSATGHRLRGRRGNSPRQRAFPTADDVVVAWPHRYLAAQAEAGGIDERTVICVLTHDPKFDVPVLEVALRLGVGYVGAMGSRKTHDDRDGSATRGGPDRRRAEPVVQPRSGWISVPEPPRRPRSRSRPTSSPDVGAEGTPAGRYWPDRIHHDAQVAGEFRIT